MANAGTLIVRFIGDTTSLDAATGKLTRNMATVGSMLTKGLTLPLVGLGVASVSSFAGFESEMAKIKGLVGLSDAEVKKFSNTILTQGPKWGRPPRELAEALYFITSSGIDSAKAMDVLKASAQASAVGLGDTQVIANLLTSAMNAYKKSGLEAADATNVLIGAVKAGKSDPAELAGAMARVLPISAEMGVSFRDVSAAFAALSLTGNDAEESATQLRGILSSLLNPAAEARKELGKLGLSAEGIRKEIREKGLLSALTTLTEKFQGNDESAGTVFGNIRALSGVMSLMGENSAQTAKIFGDLQGKQDLLGQATAANADTVEHKYNVAMSEMKATLITLGKDLAPAATAALKDITKAVENLSKWWKDLSPQTQENILKIAGIAAIAGPSIWAISKLASGVKLLYDGTATLVKGGAKTISFLADLGSGADTAGGKFGKKLADGVKAVGTSIGDAAKATKTASGKMVTNLKLAALWFKNVAISAWAASVSVAKSVWAMAVSTAKAAASMVVTLAKTAYAWALMAAKATAAAIKTAAAWVIAMGPVAWVIALLAVIIAIDVWAWMTKGNPFWVWIQIWKKIGDAALWWFNFVLGIFKDLGGWISKLGDGFGLALEAIWNTMKTVVVTIATALWDKVTGLFKAGWNLIKSGANTAWEFIKGIFNSGVDWILSKIGRFKEIPGIVYNALVSAANTVSSVLTAIGNFIWGVVGWIKDKFLGLASAAYDAGVSIAKNLGKGIKDAASAAINAAKDMIAKVGGLFPHSPAKWGPMSGLGSPDLAGEKISKMIAGGMLAAAPKVLSAASRVAEDAMVNSGANTAGMYATRSAGGGPEVNINFNSSGGKLDDAIVNILMEAIRVNPGVRARIKAAVA